MPHDIFKPHETVGVKHEPPIKIGLEPDLPPDSQSDREERGGLLQRLGLKRRSR